MVQPRFMLAATASGSGKTMITCGMLQALKNRGLSVASFKCGPDYIDPMFHRQVLKTNARNLDTYFTDEQMTRYLFARAAEDSDISVIEGVMGYYDGMGLTSSRASSAELAQVTDTPVLLIVNVRGMSLSALALIKGFLGFQENTQIRGILLNQATESVYKGLAKHIEAELGIPVYGYIPKVPELTLESRHLGLVLPEEVEALQEKIQALAEMMEQTVDLDAILRLAQTAEEISTEPPVELNKILGQAEFAAQWKPVIAVARDEAFCFIYEDNLRLLEELGAKLSFFSPLHGEKLPEDAQGLLLYGGYPELHAEKLCKNESMKESIRQAIQDGMPCMAECGGFMYLHKSMEDMAGQTWPMVGVIDGEAYRTEKLGRFGYISLTAQEEGVLGYGMKKIKGHEFHYFDSTSCGESFLAEKPIRKRSWTCIHGSEQTLMGFPHLYYYSNPGFALEFLEKCVRYGGTKK